METNQWGMFFSDTPTPSFNPNTANFAAMQDQWVTCSQVISDTVWHYLEWCYTPTVAYDHVYVGYVGDVANGTTNAWSTSPSVGFYTWIDDVFVEPITVSLTTSPDQQLCTGDSVQIWASSDLNVEWSTGQTDTAIWVSPVTTTTYYVSTTGGCVLTDSVTVTVTPCNCNIILDVNIVGTDNTACPSGNCNGTTEAIPQNGQAPYNYSWDDPNLQTTALANGLCAGLYTCIVQDNDGCLDTVSVAINDPIPPTLTLTPTNETCQGDQDGSVDFVVTGGVNPLSFLWSNTATSQNISGIGGGVYWVEVTDGNGCVFSDTTQVQPGQTVPNVSITPAVFCENDPVSPLSATPAGGTWSGTGVSANGDFDPSIGVGNYDIFYTISGQCGNADTTTIPVEAIPTIDFSADVTQGCDPLVVMFTDNGFVAGQTSFWDLGDGNTSNQDQQVQHSYTGSGTYDVSLTITSAAGCQNSLTTPDMIEVFVDPTADFDHIIDNSAEDASVQFIDQSIGAVQWNWSFGDGNSSTEQNPLHIYNGPGTYYVELLVTSGDGCTSSISYTVVIQDNLYIYVPNAFTPDGNGINDVFIPVVSGVRADDYELLIFDRWGGLVFETDKIYEGWDGTFADSDTDVQDGIYVWKLNVKDEYNAEKITKIGHVSVFR